MTVNKEIMKKIRIISILLLIALTSNAQQNKLTTLKVNNNIFHTKDSVIASVSLLAKHSGGTFEWSIIQSPSQNIRLDEQKEYIDKGNIVSSIHLYNLVPGTYILRSEWRESGENLSNEQHTIHIRADRKVITDTINVIQ